MDKQHEHYWVGSSFCAICGENRNEHIELSIAQAVIEEIRGGLYDVEKVLLGKTRNKKKEDIITNTTYEMVRFIDSLKQKYLAEPKEEKE